jgi:hypothetical protein
VAEIPKKTTATGRVFPNFEEIGEKVIPKVVTSKIFNSLKESSIGINTTFDGDQTAFNSDAAFIEAILGADLNGPNTQIAVQLRQLQDQVDEINRAHADANGMPANCTTNLSNLTIHPDDAGQIRLPFFHNDGVQDMFWVE